MEYRRLQFDIILMFKIYHKLSDLQFDHYFEHCDRKYNLRSHNFQIKSKLYTNTEQFRNFFFIRIINVWNKLPQDLVSAPNIVIFRNRLKNFNSLTFILLLLLLFELFLLHSCCFSLFIFCYSLQLFIVYFIYL